jgi:hypothetical protein
MIHAIGMSLMVGLVGLVVAGLFIAFHGGID